MGIAATVDWIPLWGSSDGGHAETVYFDEEANPVMLQTDNWLLAQPPLSVWIWKRKIHAILL
ncbi:hypothetical protein [Rikenella microfusus]|uniref:hypothetical protein n=1 Tax=Rikenella microfusus TaxID=28139 RepID=UPI00248DD596|nr:hypothetical protein [Rikenella microfusus]